MTNRAAGDGAEPGHERPSPRNALERASEQVAVTLPGSLLLDVLNLEESADPQGLARERQARLQMLIEQASRAE